VIVSPSLWWDRGVLFSYEEQYRARSEALAARVFLAAGEHDGRNILQDLLRMEGVLEERRYQGLDYRVQLFPDETHRTVFPIAVTHGLRFLFSDASSNQGRPEAM
jgi:predicted alpha/beta superfamily hydrolase